MAFKLETDWNCRLLAGFPDQIARSDAAAEALTALLSRSTLRRFLFLPVFDPAQDSVALFQIRANNALKALQSRISSVASLSCAASVALLPRLSEYKELRRLCLPKTDYLAISLPLTPTDWAENELAKLARYAPFRVFLTNVHLLPIFYPPETVDRLLNLPNMAYQFSIQSLENPANDRLFRRLLDRRAPILFGSAVNSLGKAYRFDEAFSVGEARKRFRPFELERLLFNRLENG